jgi:hypothetical protein
MMMMTSTITITTGITTATSSNVIETRCVLQPGNFFFFFFLFDLLMFTIILVCTGTHDGDHHHHHIPRAPHGDERLTGPKRITITTGITFTTGTSFNIIETRCVSQPSIFFFTIFF